MALTKFLILRKPPTGPRVARPEDRLRGCLEERTVLIRQNVNSFSRSPASALNERVGVAKQRCVRQRIRSISTPMV
jgi:hypothetical protein